MAAIYLIRHGQASWGKRDYDALSEQGVEQAKILGKALAQRIDTPDRIICGGMRRHRQTAEHALAAMGLRSDWQEDKRWDEYDHQELIVRHKPLYKSRTLMLADLARTLKPKETFQEIFEQALHRWVAREHDHEYHESWPVFLQRVNEGLQHLAETGDRNILVFTSGGAISAVTKTLWNMPDSEWMRLNRVIANASITKVVVGKRGLHLSTFNEHAHFEGEQRAMLTYR